MEYISIKNFNFKQEMNNENVKDFRVVILKTLFFFKMGFFLKYTKNKFRSVEEQIINELESISKLESTLKIISLYEFCNFEEKNVLPVNNINFLEKITNFIPEENRWFSEEYFTNWVKTFFTK